MRLTLSKDDAISLMITLQNKNEDLKKVFSDKVINILDDIKNQIEKDLNTPAHHNKKLAAKRATIIRQERVKEKIRNAVNLLHLENAKINVNSVSKKAGVSYNTAKKYKYFFSQFDKSK